MPGRAFSPNDAAQLRELADAIRELERSLNSSIASELGEIADALRGLSGSTQDSISGIQILLNTLRDFALIGGVVASIKVLYVAFKNIGAGVDVAKKALTAFKMNPKILGITALIAGISLVVGELSGAFRSSEPALCDAGASNRGIIQGPAA